MTDQKQAKRRYVAPQVTRHGDVRTLTQGPGGGTIDQIFGGNGGFQPTS